MEPTSQTGLGRPADARNARRLQVRVARDKMQVTNSEGLDGAWEMIGGLWAGTVGMARKQPSRSCRSRSTASGASYRDTVT